MSFDPNAAAAHDAGVYGLPHGPEQAAVVLLPVPFDATTSYKKGAADGPAAILAASRQVDLYDLELGRIYEPGIAMLPSDGPYHGWNLEARALAAEVIDAVGHVAGDLRLERALERVNELSASLNARVEDDVNHWLEKGKLVALIGGDHATPFGAIAAHARRWPGLGVLHFDAHADLRPAYEGFTWSHASIMNNVLARLPDVAKLVSVGVRDFSEEELQIADGHGARVSTFHDVVIQAAKRRGVPFANIAKTIAETLPREVYVSFDIDGLSPSLCPNTGTPVPGGLSLDEALAIVEAVVESGRTIVGLDLNEVAPGPDGDEWDGNVGARLLYKLIGWALVSQKKLARPAAIARAPELR
jgi:agmatinase